MSEPKRRIAICGANYAGTPYALRNPLNDVATIANLAQRHGLEVNQATESDLRVDVLRDLFTWLREANEPGGVMSFYYSGHGAQLPSPDEPDGTMEALVMYDSDFGRPESFWRDVDTVDFFRTLCPMAHCTVILDSCFSGGMAKAGAEKAVRSAIPARYLPNPYLVGVRRLGRVRRLVPFADNFALMAACREPETASDGKGNDGAFTEAFEQCLDGRILATPAALVVAINQLLELGHYEQHAVCAGGQANIPLWE